MTNLYRVGSLLLLTVIVTGCGVIRDRSGDYIDAEAGTEMHVPAWYDQERVRSRYPIPQVGKPTPLDRDFEMPRPPETAIASTDKFSEFEKLGEQDWLLVNMAPGRVWPSLDKFWEVNGLYLDHENPGLGLMQTGQIGLSAKSRQLLESMGLDVDAAHYAIQVKLGPGVKRHTSELQLRVIAIDTDDNFLPWQAVSQQRELEHRLLMQVSDYLSENKDRPGYSLLANEIGGSARVSLIAEKSKQAYIKLDLPFERAWSAAEKSIKKSEIRILDRDRTAGLYYVYVPQESKGWLASLFTGDDAQDEANALVKLVKEKSGSVLLTVNRTNGDELSDERLRNILNRLLENIS